MARTHEAVGNGRDFAHVLDRLRGVKPRRYHTDSWLAICPVHPDTNPSLGIDLGRDGKKLLVKCHGCGAGMCEVAKALRLKPSDFFLDDEPRRRSMGRVIEEVYDYFDESGELVYQAVRWFPKGFSQRRPDGNGGWINDLDGVRRVLYRLHDIRSSSRDRVVFVVEGERKADRLADLGCIATSNVGGSAKWDRSYSAMLAGRRVAVVPDNDDAGRKHQVAVCGDLLEYATELRIVRLPNLPVKGDVVDWLKSLPASMNAAARRQELHKIFETSPTWVRQSAKTVSA